LNLKASQRIARSTRVTVDLKTSHDNWISWCESKGLTPSEGVRQAILALMTGEGEGTLNASPPVSSLPVVADEVWRESRVQIRLTQAEHAAVSEASLREGMSLSRWFVGLARRHLFGEPQFGRVEVEALSRSSQALLALGRSVNQIAHRLSDCADSEAMNVELARTIRREIGDHTGKVAAMLKANSARWSR
jgi:hypothetical protein